MDVWEEARMWLTLLLLFSGLCERTAASLTPEGVECIVFNEDYMICDWGSKGKPVANYSLHYWYSKSVGTPFITECKHYLQTDGINTGCWFNRSEIEICCSFHVNISSGPTGVIRSKSFLLQHLVKPDPPVNFTVQTGSDNQLLLTWNTPFHDHDCLEHAVQYMSNKDSQWMEQKTPGMKFNVPSVDPDKFYTFYVRSKISQNCGTTNLWSEKTGPIFWGKNTTNVSSWFRTQDVLVPIGSVAFLLVFLLTLMQVERVRLVLMPRIPNPSKKFEDLFTAYQGNFSEWAGVSKDAVESFKPNYRESICHVSELLPGGGYLPVCNDTMGKAGRVPEGSADHTHKVNTE